MRYDLTLNDARQTIAREYGFANWADVAARGEHSPAPDFEAAAHAVLSGDTNTLRALLAQNPALVHKRSRYGHHAALLHHVASNGVETHPQVVPHSCRRLPNACLMQAPT